MKKTVLFSLAALLSAGFAGCSTTENSNANLKTNVNSNTAVVINSNTVSVTNSGSGNTNKALTRDEFDKNKDTYSKQAKDAGDKIGQSAEDLWIWTKAKAALATVDGLRDSTVNVDVENAVVTLRGTVASAAQKDAAVKAAKVEGVSSVKDMLQVDAKDSMTNQMTGSNAGSGNTGKTANSNANMKK